MREMIEEAITEQFGERCPDFDADCFCCQVWSQYDDLVEQRATIEALRTEIEAVKRERDAWIPEPMASFKAGEDAAARFGMKRGELQAAWRNLERHDPKEIEWAIVDALSLGGWAVHPGDGVGCAAQIVYAQIVRAEALRTELEAVKREAVEVLKPFADAMKQGDWRWQLNETIRGLGPDLDIKFRHLRAARAFVEKHGRDE